MSFDRNLLPDTVSYFEAQGLKLAGPRSSKWKTTACQFHGGSDSMRINTHSGGWCCMSCDAKGGDVLSYHMQLHSVEFVEACKAIGCWVDDGKTTPHQKPTPLAPRAALQVMAFEATVVAVAAGNVAHGVKLSDVDRFRVLAAAGRISRLAGAYS